MKKTEKEELDSFIEYYSESKDNIKRYLTLFNKIQLELFYNLIKIGKYNIIKKLYSHLFNNKINFFLDENKKLINLSNNDEIFEGKIKLILNYFSEIINVEKFWNEIFNQNNIKEELKKIYKCQTIYIKSFDDEEYEEDILNIFYSLTGNLPLFSNIFIFGEKTEEQDYLPFLYKVTKTNSFFIMVLKNCKNENIDILLKKINEILLNGKESFVFLLLYYRQNISKIKKYIKNYKQFEYKQGLYIKENIKKILYNKVGIVYSDISGTGKTTYINNLARMNYNMKLIYFPIKGNYTKNELLYQLKNTIIIQKNYNYIIHIDIYDSKDENVIKEFLFYFIFFKFYGEDIDIINYGCFDNNIKIIIELPNTFKNYFDKYKILNYIPIIKDIKILKENKLPNLKEKAIINHIGDSKIQIVSNIINLYNKDEIKYKNIDMNSQILLSEDKSEEIINKALNGYVKNYPTINFYQKINFIKLLSTEFQKYTLCSNLAFGEMNNLRKNIIKSIIINSKYIIELNNFEKMLYEININKLKESDRETNFQKKIYEIQQEKNKINYNKLSPSLIALQNDGNFVSLISSNDNCELFNDINNHIKEINENYKLALEYIKKPIEYNDKELRRELLKIIVDENFLNNEKSNYEYIEDILDKSFEDYVFTLDNFIKMVLLFLRIRAGIPTIIIGETGCGKTYLIKMLSIIYGQNANIYTLKFHAGITDDNVINFIKDTICKVEKDENDLIERRFEYMYENKYIENYRKNEEKYYSKLWFFQKWFFKPEYKNKYKNYKDEIIKRIKNRKIILFFDEINTSYSLGTIKRIICEENFRQNYNIPDRFIIICACNSYRFLSEENNNLQFGLSMRYQKNRKLVYTVNPLPYSLLNFALYFNNISKETAKQYIEKMNEKMNEKLKKSIDINNMKLINKLVSESHFFIIEKGDISSVSLREINRFPKIFKFFAEEYFNIYKNQILKKEELETKSLSFGLYFCYYLRLPTSKLRKDYIKKVVSKDLPQFLDICKRETIFITEQILEGKKGYAKNRGLCDNIFTEFICLLLREPLIICGKPGSSKSLSVRLLLNAMKGKRSHIEFFKQFPEVIQSFYQCSLTSTSEKLEKVFDNARNKLEIFENQIISLIFIDEMGIADESKNNPLKVLHSKLDENNENDNLDKKLTFIGISNWTLDASKMNRAINIVVEEPDLDYLLITTKEIVCSIDEKIGIIFEKVIKAISESYLDYLNIQSGKNREDFHGFRDYYYLIKNIFYNISQNYKNNDNINNYLIYIFKGIYHNFGGFIDSSKQKSEEIFKNLFLEKYSYEKIGYGYNILERIKNNLDNCIDSRYLLLITNKDKTNEILIRYILQEKEYVQFSEEDINQYDNQSNAILNLLLKIEVLMKKEIILILKNLEILYPSLYELFNKNFNEYGSGNKFVKISYEERQSLVQVNEKFRIIILVNEDNLNLQEKPFLNRFEKQLFSVDNIFDKKELDLKNFCLNIVEKFKMIYNIDYITEDLLYIIMMKNMEKEQIESCRNNNFWNLLVPLFPQEIIYYLNNNKIENSLKYKNNINIAFKNYYIKNYNFKSFLSNTSSQFNTIYTYSGINTPFFDNNDTTVYNQFYKMEFSPKKIKTIFLAKEYDFKIINYLVDIKKYNLYIIKIDENQLLHSNNNIYENIKKYVSYMEKLMKNKNIIVLYIIYKKKRYKEIEINSKEKMNNIYELFLLYNQLFIDNLNVQFIKEDKFEILLTNFLGKKEDLINDENFMEKDILNDTFNKIKLQIQNEDGHNCQNVNKIQNELRKNKDIFKLIKNKISSIIKVKKIELSNLPINEKSDFINGLFAFNKNEISETLKNIINYLENELILSTILFSNLSKNDIKNNNLYKDFKDLLNKFVPTNNYNGIKYIYFGFNLVGLFKDYKKLNILISNKDNNNQNINIKEEILLNDNFKIKENLEGTKEEKKYLFNDYILYFISLIIELKSPKEKRDKIIIFINLILKLSLIKNNDITSYLNKNDYIDNLINKNQKLITYFENMCIFLQNYKQYLSNILNILNDFLSIIPDFNDKFISNCKNNIKYADNEKVKLFQIFNVFLERISDESNFSLYFSANTKNEYLKILQKNRNKYEIILNSIEKKYSLPLFKIDVFLYIVKKNNENFLKKALNFFKNTFEINEEYLNEGKKIINDDKILLKFIIKKNKINNKNDIFDIFYSNEKFFKYSQCFFGYILNEYIDKKSLSDGCNKFLNIKTEIGENLNKILSYNNKKFNKNLLFYFEIIYENFYFAKIQEENKEKKYKKILEGNTLETVIKYIEFYENNKNNMNIELIYRIAFIKIYFRYFTNILYECKNRNEYIDFDNLVNNKFYLSAKVLSSVKKEINIYISSILNIKCKNLDKFIIDCKLNYLENFAKEIDNKEESIFLNVIKSIPNLVMLKEKFNSENTFKQKYPLLNYCLNKDQEINYLKQIPIINYICNLMLDIFSYRKNYKEIEETKLIDEIDNIKNIKHNWNSNSNFEEIILKYIKSYNYLLKANNFTDNIIPENDYKNISIKTFLVNENNKNNRLNYIYYQFIKYQNKFLNDLKEYFVNKNLDVKEAINVQESTEENIPRIISSDDEFLEILINNSSIIENNKKEIEFEFDLMEIENELADKIIPGLKFFNENKIRIMKYSGEEYNEIDEQIINDFIKRYKTQNINEGQKNYIKQFIEKYKEKKNLILLSFQYLMSFILSYPEFNGETNIKEVISKVFKNNDENEKIELIQLFFNDRNLNQNENVNQSESERLNTTDLMNDSKESESLDTLERMNDFQENDDFIIYNLYSIFHEIKYN